MDKITVVDQTIGLAPQQFCGELGVVHARIGKLVDQYGTDAWLEYGQYEPDDWFSFRMMTWRQETDKEAADRQLQEQELGQLTKLLAKYQHNPQVVELLVNFKGERNET